MFSFFFSLLFLTIFYVLLVVSFVGCAVCALYLFVRCKRILLKTFVDQMFKKKFDLNIIWLLVLLLLAVRAQDEDRGVTFAFFASLLSSDREHKEKTKICRCEGIPKFHSRKYFINILENVDKKNVSNEKVETKKQILFYSFISFLRIKSRTKPFKCSQFDCEMFLLQKTWNRLTGNLKRVFGIE